MGNVDEGSGSTPLYQEEPNLIEEKQIIGDSNVSPNPTLIKVNSNIMVLD